MGKNVLFVYSICCVIFLQKNMRNNILNIVELRIFDRPAFSAQEQSCLCGSLAYILSLAMLLYRWSVLS